MGRMGRIGTTGTTGRKRGEREGKERKGKEGKGRGGKELFFSAGENASDWHRTGSHDQRARSKRLSEQ